MGDVTRRNRADRGSEPEVVSISTAPVNREDEIDHRARRYVMQMLIRLVCFIGAVVVDGPVRWVLIAAAVFLPYFAVVGANATPKREAGHVDDVTATDHRALPYRDDR